MLIPYKELSEDILGSIAKEWVISKLSDSEAHPMVHQWTEQTVAKVKSGELVIEFGEQSQTVYLKSKDDLDLDEMDLHDIDKDDIDKNDIDKNGIDQNSLD